MGALADWQIRNEIKINPLVEGIKREGKISYGLTSYGLDLRLGYTFKVFKPYPCTTINPKEFDSRMLEDVTLTEDDNKLIIPPHSFVLAETFEYIEIPRDVVSIVLGKSTYARCGLIVNCTPLEPEWRGKITLELSNTTPLPMVVFAGEGICQCIFLRSDGVNESIMEALSMQRKLLGGTCEISYADKKGRYNDQTGLTLPTVDRNVTHPEGK